jgi:hypothetical protein
LRPLYTPAFLARAIPSRWRSCISDRSNSAKWQVSSGNESRGQCAAPVLSIKKDGNSCRNALSPGGSVDHRRPELRRLPAGHFLVHPRRRAAGIGVRGDRGSGGDHAIAQAILAMGRVKRAVSYIRVAPGYVSRTPSPPSPALDCGNRRRPRPSVLLFARRSAAVRASWCISWQRTQFICRVVTQPVARQRCGEQVGPQGVSP